MKKIFFLSSLVCNAILFAQTTPMITKWKTTDEKDKQIAIKNRGTANYTFEQVGKPSNSGSGKLYDDYKTYIDLPAPGEYIVTITPTSPFTLFMYGTAENEALELKEIQQWGNFETGSSASSMLSNCKDLTITATDIPNFSTITDMSNMFRHCSAITDIPNINQWDVSNVDDMTNMFNWATQFNANISNWNTGKVRIMTRMFAEAEAFNQDISNWNTSNVRNMSGMFRTAKSFNQDLSKWNTENVFDFKDMFEDAVAFNQNLGNFNLKNATKVTGMLKNAGLSCENYSKTLQGWAKNASTPENLVLDATGLKYGEAGKTFRDMLVNTKKWKITGDEFDASCVVNLSTKEINAKEGIKVENPVRDILKIQSKEAIQSAEIYDMNGRLIKTFSTNESNISDLQKGIYILKVVQNSGISTLKLMKL